jgi:hypothetical protein
MLILDLNQKCPSAKDVALLLLTEERGLIDNRDRRFDDAGLVFFAERSPG